jgi:plastocyanin
MMRTALIALVLTFSLAVAAPAVAKTRSVKIGDNYFVRKGSVPTVTVKKGTTVKWRWTGRHDHDVVATGPADFQSPLKSSGTYKKKVTKKGTYSIVCLIHSGMKMKLKVKA